MALRRVLGSAARALGVRGESTAAAAVAQAPASSLASLGVVPSSDPVMQPYYEELANMEVVPAKGVREASDSERAVRAACRCRRRLHCLLHCICIACMQAWLPLYTRVRQA